MRWDNLFDDLESQLEHELTAEEIDLRAEEERLRLARLSLRDRILAVQEARGEASVPLLRLLLAGERMIDVRAITFGRDWFAAELVELSGRRSQCVVPLAAVAGLVLTRQQVELSLRPVAGSEVVPVRPVGVPDAGAGSSLSARLGLGYVLRDLCRRRRAIELHLATGMRLQGTIDRVGRDHFDMALHDAGVARRERDVTQYRVIPFEAIELVRI
ncbi:hypothetical protein FB562_0538 [Homoserinimonas aerilata]|uniref:Uncharacterized protein n=1 Tax=Homoserinimonas aerilata TaxID=1162970 RepID=A0A542YHC2_9MICO|nr:hypothetical protein [Homoserinimonas aerilata]TQL47477.1 hypothetical protein FB562_0538 [Homoserinimonas aerilata]